MLNAGESRNFISYVGNMRALWPSEARLKQLYRSSAMTTRSTLKLVHHLEQNTTSYTAGMAWFCLDGEERVLNAGWLCRTSYHTNHLPQNLFRLAVTRHDVEPLLDLGDPSAMRAITSQCGHAVVSLEGRDHQLSQFLDWTTHADAFFASIPSAAQVLVARQGARLALKDMATRPDVFYNHFVAMSKEEFVTALRERPEACMRNHHNDDSVHVMRAIAQHSPYRGWQYADNQVYYLRRLDKTRLVLEQEPGELLLPIKEPKFAPFRAWVQARKGNVFVAGTQADTAVDMSPARD